MSLESGLKTVNDTVHVINITLNDTSRSMSMAVHNLTRRVDNIEDLDSKFWIPTAIAIFAIGVSVYQFFRQTKNATFSQVEQNIDSARLFLTEKALELTNNNSTNLKALDACEEHLFNKLDDGCRKFFKYKLNRKEFKYKYNDVIADYIEKYPDKFASQINKYEYMVMFYKKMHKTIKQGDKTN